MRQAKDLAIRACNAWMGGLGLKPGEDRLMLRLRATDARRQAAGLGDAASRLDPSGWAGFSTDLATMQEKLGSEELMDLAVGAEAEGRVDDVCTKGLGLTKPK